MKCQWKKVDTIYVTSCTAQFNPPGPLKIVGFNYCPYCGKEIEEIE